MTQNDISKVLSEAFETMEPRRAPADLLTNVYTVTRAIPQRRGFSARLWTAGQSVASLAETWRVRPVVSFAVLIAILALLLVSAAFVGGMLRDRHPAGWRMLGPEPAIGEYISVTSIVSTSTGFVAVGAADRPSAVACQNDQSRGLVWTSVDGYDWVETANDSFVGVRPAGLVASGDALYMFGVTELCSQEPIAARVWRSTDGVAWTLLPESEPFNLGNIPTIVDVDGTLVASGGYEVPSDANPGVYGEWEWRVWISTDWVTWERVFSDRDSYIGGLATNGESLVALVSSISEPAIKVSISHDLGRTWSEAETPRFVTNSLAALTMSGDRYVAIGQNVALTSTDGQTWTSATTEFSSGFVNSQLFPLPNGFLVTGVRNDGATALECRAGGQPRPSIQVLPTGEPERSDQPETPDLGVPSETCVPVPGSGGTWVSRDGSEWKRGADLPQERLSVGGTTYVLAAGHDALVASYYSVIVGEESPPRDGFIAGEASRGGMLWYAPLSEFRP